MATSWASETNEKVNYSKLCRLLYDGGTLAVRTVFDGIVPPASLAAKLAAYQHKLLNLKIPKGKVLNQDQWDLLYPPSGSSPKSEQYDITLLFVLLRNICSLTPPLTGWNDLPAPADASLQANLARIKFCRNTVTAHCSKAEIDDAQFEKYWNEISVALVALGMKQCDIDCLKSTPLGEKDYNQLVEYWDLSDREIKQNLETITYNTSQIMTDTSQLKENTSQIMADTSQLIKMESDIAEIKDCVKPGTIAINKLAHRNFDSTIQKLCDKCRPNTREWLISNVKSSVQDSNYAIIKTIQAGPGMGKSVVAAKLCQEYKRQGILGGCHFFKHDNSLLNNPRLMFQSVARQLCDIYPGYCNSLSENLSTNLGKEIIDLTCEELFTLLFEEPCSKFTPEGYTVIIIDALDECCNSLKMELFKILGVMSSRLPSWLRFILTTRPPPTITALDFGGFKIDPTDYRNTNDLKVYITDQIKEQGHKTISQDDDQTRKLVEMCEGIFLVAYFVVDFLSNTTEDISISQAVERFPKEKGITSVYEDYFSRLHKALRPHILSEEGFYDMLEAVTAAKYPIEKTMFYSILGLKDEPRIPNKDRKEAIHLLHQLFPVENDHVSAFHKTVIDWLTADGHDFSVKGDGCDVLANQCYSIINAIKDSAKPRPDQSPGLTDCDTYALKYAPLYIKESKAFSKETKREMETDPAVLCLQAFTYVEEYKRKEAMNYGSSSGPYSVRFDECLSSDCKDIYDCLKSYFSHKREDCFFKHLTYTELLHLAYQAAFLLQIGDTEKTLTYLQENSIPYIESVTLLDVEKKEQIKQIIGYNSGFLVVVVVQDVNEVSLLRNYNLNGKLTKEVPFSQYKEIHMSPNDEFIVAVSLTVRGDIEIIDTTSFDVKISYKCPNVVKTCHVFGKQPWYILFRCFNNKLYIMNGETGELLVDRVEVQENEVVLKVSNQGHIVLAITNESFTSQHTANLTHKFEIFTDEEGCFCEKMIWRDAFDMKAIQNGLQKPSKGIIYLSRKLFLCKFKTLDENMPINEGNKEALAPYSIYSNMPIYSRRHIGCACQNNVNKESSNSLTTLGQPLCFSEDGKLLAFYYNYHITVVHTSDGSLYKSVCLSFLHLSIKDILYLTNEELIIYGSADYMSNAMFCSQIRFGESKYDFELEQFLYIPSNVNILRTIKSDNNLKSLMVQQFPVEHRLENNTKDILKLDFHI